MNTALATSPRATIVIGATSSPPQNAARRYLSSLHKDRTRQTMEQSIGVIAHVILYGDVPIGDQVTGSREQRRAGAADLRSLIDLVPWYEVDKERANTVASCLHAHYSITTYNKTISALRGTLLAAIDLVREAGRAARAQAATTDEVLRLGVLSQDRQDALAEAIKQLKSINVADKEENQAAGRMLTLGEMMSLFGVCQDGTKAGARDAALLGVGIGCGLRRAELAALDLADYDATTGALVVRRGKGDKKRTVYVTNGAQAALEDWLDVRGRKPGPLFVSIQKGDGLTVQRLTTNGVYCILAARADAAGVARFSPHDLRRTFISNLLDNGCDLVAVQKLAGHENPATTAKYDRRGERAKQGAAKTMHIPYQKRSK